MTRKHYVMIAAALMRARADIIQKEPERCHGDMLDGVSLAAEHVCDVLAQDNSAFDRGRFLKAAGVES